MISLVHYGMGTWHLEDKSISSSSSAQTQTRSRCKSSLFDCSRSKEKYQGIKGISKQHSRKLISKVTLWLTRISSPSSSSLHSIPIFLSHLLLLYSWCPLFTILPFFSLSLLVIAPAINWLVCEMTMLRSASTISPWNQALHQEFSSLIHLTHALRNFDP